MRPVVRPVRPSDRDEWVRMREALWSESPEDHPTEVDAYLAARGCREMASDAAPDNEPSLAWHEDVGFRKAAVLVAYRRELA